MLVLGALLLLLLGLLIGSFLNVVIWRVPRDESVVSPGSHCPHCGKPLSWADNVPVLSWVRLRGRARCCGEPIPVRYPLVELSTGAAFAGVGIWNGADWFLPAYLYLAAITIALAVIDVEVHRLPDAIVLPSYPVVALLLVLGTALEGTPWWSLVRAALAGLALWLFYFTLRVISPRGMGYGDVKLAGLLGLYLGRIDWAHVFAGTLLGVVFGGALIIVLLATRRAGRKSMIPYGPNLLLGAWTALLFGGAIIDWYLGIYGIQPPSP